MAQDRASRLQAGLSAMGMALTEQQRCRLLAYIDLLHRWNRSYNLTAVRDKDAMIAKHLLDSLALSRWVEGTSVLDMGTGAGLPGIPLAIAMPERHFLLVDSVGKKIRFVNHVRRSLALDNIEPLHTRLESVLPLSPVDTVTARAVADLPQLAAWACPVLKPGGVLLAARGRDVHHCRSLALDGWLEPEVQELAVPDLPAARHLVIMRRSSDVRTK